ncbi:MAG: TetR/AcrR family transcriptional regulator [Parvibaculum sp.]|nr:TetR/AcrR family transcriptional regulator [Parvibaculum sp.]
MGNRDRILELSLKLLNEEGAQAAGTTRIAQVLGISPGNLYYHFRNREAIVRGLFAGLEAEFRAMMVDDVVPPILPERFAAFYLRSFDVAWNYRFFFGGLHHLLRQDEELAASYRQLQAWAIDELEGIVRQLVKDGSMEKPRSKNGLRSLGLNTWIIWMNWIRFVQISGRDQVTRDDMIEGVGQIFDLLVPYLDPAFEKAARRVLTRELRSNPT